MNEPVRVERKGPVTTVIIDRPGARNAVNGPTAPFFRKDVGDDRERHAPQNSSESPRDHPGAE